MPFFSINTSPTSATIKGKINCSNIQTPYFIQHKCFIENVSPASLRQSIYFCVIKLLKKQATDFGAQLIVNTHDSRLKKHFKKSIEL